MVLLSWVGLGYVGLSCDEFCWVLLCYVGLGHGELCWVVLDWTQRGWAELSAHPLGSALCAGRDVPLTSPLLSASFLPSALTALLRRLLPSSCSVAQRFDCLVTIHPDGAGLMASFCHLFSVYKSCAEAEQPNPVPTYSPAAPNLVILPVKHFASLLTHADVNCCCWGCCLRGEEQDMTLSSNNPIEVQPCCTVLLPNGRLFELILPPDLHLSISTVTSIRDKKWLCPANPMKDFASPHAPHRFSGAAVTVQRWHLVWTAFALKIPSLKCKRHPGCTQAC